MIILAGKRLNFQHKFGSCRPELLLNRRAVRYGRHFAGPEKGWVASDRALEMPNVGVPLNLDFLDGADELLERGEVAALLSKLQRVGVIAVIFKQEMSKGPPMEIIQIEVAVHARSAAIFDNGAEGNDAIV